MIRHWNTIMLLTLLTLPTVSLDTYLGYVSNISSFINLKDLTEYFSDFVSGFQYAVGKSFTPETLKVVSSAVVDFEVNTLRQKFGTSADKRRCFDDFLRLVKEFTSGEQWAVKTFDSWGKIGSGVFEGYVLVRGDLSLCLKSHPENNSTLSTYTNHFCWLDLNNAFLRITGRGFRFGICLPKSCSQPTLMEVINKLQALIKQRPKFLPYLYIPSCYSKRNSDYFSYRLESASIIICIIIITLMLLGTLYDLWMRLFCNGCLCVHVEKQPKKYKLASNKDIRGQLNKEAMMFSIDEDNENEKSTNDICTDLITEEMLSSPPVIQDSQKNSQKPHCCGKSLLSFSVITNMYNLFKIKEQEGQLNCLNGIRSLSIAWVVMGHTVSHLFPDGDNIAGLYEMTKFNHLGSSVLLGGYYGVDSFFVMSGMLLTYLFMGAVEKGQKLNWITWFRFYIDRIIRLSPANWFMLFVLYWGILSYNPQGPADVFGPGVQKICSSNWWYYVLYINNFLSQECFGIDWYLGDDMQFYWISPIFLILFIKIGPWVGVIMSAITIASVGISYKILTDSRVLDLTFYLFNKRQYPHMSILFSNMYLKFYIRPYCRIGAYLIGMYFGWILFKTKCSLRLSKLLVIALWILGIACLFFAFYLCIVVNMSDLGLYLFLSSSHYFWSLGLAILIFLCCIGYGGIFNSIMAWTGWMPLSKLSYSVYLMHFIAMKLFYFNTEERFHITIVDTYIHFTSLIIWDFGAGLLLHLAVEAPFINLRKALFG